MKRTVKALQDLYVKLGGQLTDTYANIADGIKVGLYKRIPDIIEAVKEKASGGGGGAGLPEVTSADNGDVLTVVEGAWAKASPSGGDVFDIKFTATYDETTDDYTASSNKTLAEILAEYQAHGYDNMRVTWEYPDSPTSINLAVKFEITASDMGACFIGFSLPDNKMHAINAVMYPDPDTQEDMVAYEEKFYTLTPSE